MKSSTDPTTTQKDRPSNRSIYAFFSKFNKPITNEKKQLIETKKKDTGKAHNFRRRKTRAKLPQREKLIQEDRRKKSFRDKERMEKEGPSWQ